MTPTKQDEFPAWAVAATVKDMQFQVRMYRVLCIAFLVGAFLMLGWFLFLGVALYCAACNAGNRLSVRRAALAKGRTRL